MTLNEALLTLEKAQELGMLIDIEVEAFGVLENFIASHATQEEFDTEYELEPISAVYEDEDKESDDADFWKE